MILPKDGDPRFVTIRRGGTLSESDHQILVLWAASCAEHVLGLFETAQPEDRRPRQAIDAPGHGDLAVHPGAGLVEHVGRLECRWQRNQLPTAIRELVLDDQRMRNDICRSVFDS